MSKKKEVFEELVSEALVSEELVSEELFNDVPESFNDSVVSEEGGDESFQEIVEDKDPGNKTRGFRN